MTEFSLEKVFKSNGADRANFLSRLFGLFNEELVRLWGEMESAPYEYLGRPTIYPKDANGYTTLDFALRRRTDGCNFVTEMKCEIAYQGFRYMTLTGVEQVQRHISEQKKAGKVSFPRFVEAALYPDRFNCTVTTRNGKRSEIAIAGAILVWGNTSEAGRETVIEEFAFADVLSVQDIINELIQAGEQRYLDFVEQRGNWCRQLFSSLVGEYS